MKEEGPLCEHRLLLSRTTGAARTLWRLLHFSDKDPDRLFQDNSFNLLNLYFPLIRPRSSLNEGKQLSELSHLSISACFHTALLYMSDIKI